MIILGIETSCDETAAAVVEDGTKLLSNVVASSVDLHAAYGGVVPEIAARSHIESIIPVINQALADAFGIKDERLKIKDTDIRSSRLATPRSPQAALSDPWEQIDAIGVTYGPGLGGSLLIGVMTARTFAIAKNKPLYGVNHVEAHPYAAFLTQQIKVDSLQPTDNSLPLAAPHSQHPTPLSPTPYSLSPSMPKFPILALIVSGGHTQIVLFRNHFDYTLLGQTGDDAIGEAFDKVAKILGLPYPGGPSVSEAAKNGDSFAISLPRAKMPSPYEFSYSGLKTAVLRASQKIVGKDFTLPSTQLPGLLSEQHKADMAASFQRVALEAVVDALATAEKEYSPASVIVAGGVAANSELRRMLAEKIKSPLFIPDFSLCTDNAAMIAANAYFQASTGQPPADPYKLSIEPNLSM